MANTEIAEHVNRIKKEYAKIYEKIQWITPEAAEQAKGIRDRLILEIFKETGAAWKFSDTKLISHGISPGCTLCGEGEWSCLFINGICNAKCFYCPSSQQDKGDPITSSVEFPNALDYADYVNRFKIKGVSFSGGEPFLTFDKVIHFLKTLREKVPHPLYIWMYTNGILVTADKLKALRDNGLDEIRFDLSADHYTLGGPQKAVGIIPRVTVEIPAIPEDLDKTKKMIGELYSAGVDYLNLHQIRCTEFNRPKLIKRGYNFLHGPGVTILETELTALELIRYGLEQNIPLPMNYCAFTYRHQHQKAGAMKRNALMIKAAHEEITATGHIRAMGVWGEPEQISKIHDRFISENIDPQFWKRGSKGDHLLLHSSLLPELDTKGLRLKIGYSGTALRPSVSFRHPFKEIPLNKGKKVVIERFVRKTVWLEEEQAHQFGALFLGQKSGPPTPPSDLLPDDVFRQIKKFESISPGLAQYY